VIVFGLQISAGCVAPVVAMTLTDQTGNALDLEPLDSLLFRMVDARDGHVQVNDVEATKAQVDGSAETFGQVFYQWTVSDTSRPGLYRAWFVVDQGSGPTRYPIGEALYVLVEPAP
jgi:hypothetical protein